MITVRLATMQDAQDIARQTTSLQHLHNEALPGVFKPTSEGLFPPQKLDSCIQDPNRIVAVAEMEGRVVGHIYGGVGNRPENEFTHPEACIYIYQIGVDEEVRRKGVGNALVSFIRDQALALGITVMQVEHWAFNGPAVAFFGACGFSSMKIVMRRNGNDR